MIIRTVVEVNLGYRKEYVDSKVYEAIREIGYKQGRESAIDEFADLLKKMANDSSTKYIRISDYAVNHDLRFYSVDEIAEQLKEKANVC